MSQIEDMDNIHDLLVSRLAPDQPTQLFSEGYSFDRQLDINEIRKELEDWTVTQAIGGAVLELARAERLYPEWPADPVHMVSIMAEEAGEAVRAANNLKWGHHKGTTEEAEAKLRTELIQTAAMCLRMLKHMPEFPA